MCQAFSDEKMPSVRLHGDAHVEQYGLTSTANGLDDFDDSAEGPAVVDLVRFIGSLELAASRRGWQSRANRAIDQFLKGYQQALRDPSYVPRIPKVVERRRARQPPSPAAFLASSDQRMEPVSAPVDPQARAALALVAAEDTSAPPGFFTLKRIGALQAGVGSYTTPKYLMRVEGRTPADSDDVILEAKEVSDLGGVSCITTPNDGKAVRVITGSRQIGRLQHDVLSVIQGLSTDTRVVAPKLGSHLCRGAHPRPAIEPGPRRAGPRCRSTTRQCKPACRPPRRRPYESASSRRLPGWNRESDRLPQISRVRCVQPGNSFASRIAHPFRRNPLHSLASICERAEAEA